MGLRHLIRDYVAIDVQRRADVGMEHQLLLDGNRRPHSIQPRTVTVRGRPAQTLLSAIVESWDAYQASAE